MSSSFQRKPPEIPPGLKELIEQQAKWQKDLARQLTAVIEFQRSLQPTFEAIAKLQRPLELFSKRVLQDLQPTIQRASEVYTKQLLDLGRQLAERFKEQIEIERKALALLAPRGWLISPSLSASAPRTILETVEEIGIDETERQLIQTFDADFLETVITRCQDRASYIAWQEKLAMAMEAHRNGQYALAIPIWLIVIEGILSEELSTDSALVDDVFTRVQRKQGVQIRRAFGVSNPFVDPLLDGMIQVLRMFGRPRDSETDGSANPVLRRHAIMHGEDPAFGSERDSIQSVLMLEVIHFYLELRDRRSGEVAS